MLALIGNLKVHENIENGGDIFWDVFSSMGPSLLLGGIDILLILGAFIILVISSVQLHKKANMPGSGPILLAIGCSVIGVIIYIVYLSIVEDEGNLIIEALFSVYWSICIVVGVYGFWILTKYLCADENANKALQLKAQKTRLK